MASRPSCGSCCGELRFISFCACVVLHAQQPPSTRGNARRACRFFDVDRGKVLLDGVDIRTMDVRQVRRIVGMVDQDTALLDRSVAENIAFGADTAAASADVLGGDSVQGRVMAAARLANAHDFIVLLPDGYSTRVGAGGGRLSGGQRQRVLLARAIFRATPVLLLDEYSSALDAESEAAVNEALAGLMGGQRTTFIIAHRLSTAMRADCIFVMDSGRIVERGSHAQLLKERPHGLYARLVKHQELAPGQTNTSGSAAGSAAVSGGRATSGATSAAASSKGQPLAAASGDVMPWRRK